MVGASESGNFASMRNAGQTNERSATVSVLLQGPKPCFDDFGTNEVKNLEEVVKQALFQKLVDELTEQVMKETVALEQLKCSLGRYRNLRNNQY